MSLQQKPNILLVFTDQQRFDTIAALGNPTIKTPVLDRLVAQGVAFTNAYTPCPVCVPARFSMLTGQMPHQTGCFDNGPMPRGWPSLMEHLAGSGYQTHGVGKMHFTFPKNPREMWGFATRDFSEEGGMQDDFRASLQAAGYGHVKDANGVRSEMYYIPQPSQLPAHLHNTSWVADCSLQFLQQRDKSRPFFLFSSYIKPHPPFEVPVPWNKLYRGPEMPLPKRPEDYEQLLCYWNRFQNRYKYRDQGTDNNLIRMIRAYYYANISFIDYNLGRLISYLADTGDLDNTLILFTSDHGELLGDYNSFGKRCFLDSAARVPLLVHYPRLLRPGLCSTPVSLIDVVPTCLQAAGLRPERPLPGESLLDLAADPQSDRLIFGQFQQKEKALYMARNQRWKYIYSAPDHKEYLFDMVVDPTETRNRACNRLYGQVASQMRQALVSYFQQDGYTDPLEGETWRAYPRSEMPEDPDAGLLFQDPPASLPADIPGYTN